MHPTLKFIEAPLWNADWCEHTCRGSISCGDLCEEFTSSMARWDRDAYAIQWETALHGILEDNWKRTAIITSMPSLDGGWMTWWPIFRINSEFRIYNQIKCLKPEQSSFATSWRRHLPQLRSLVQLDPPASSWTASEADLSEILTQVASRVLYPERPFGAAPPDSGDSTNPEKGPRT